MEGPREPPRREARVAGPGGLSAGDRVDEDLKTLVLGRAPELADVYGHLEALAVRPDEFWRVPDVQRALELERASGLRQERGAPNGLASRRLGQQGGLPPGVRFVRAAAARRPAQRRPLEDAELMVRVAPDVARHILAESPETRELHKKTVVVGKIDEATFWTAYFLADFVRRREEDDPHRLPRDPGVAVLGQARTGTEYERGMERIQAALRSRVYLQPYKHLFGPRKPLARRRALAWARRRATAQTTGGEGLDVLRLLNSHSLLITGARPAPAPLGEAFAERLSTELVPLAALLAAPAPGAVRRSPVLLRGRGALCGLASAPPPAAPAPAPGLRRGGALEPPGALVCPSRAGLLDMYQAESRRSASAAGEAAGAGGEAALGRLLRGLDRQEVLRLSTLVRSLYVALSKRRFKRAERLLADFERGATASRAGDAAAGPASEGERALAQLYGVLRITLQNLEPLARR